MVLTASCRVARVMLLAGLIAASILPLSTASARSPARQAAAIGCDHGAMASPSSAATPLATTTALNATFTAGEVTIFAAASLTDAFTRLADDLEAGTPGLTLTFNFAGSQTLVTQLAEGAPADLFASADERQMAAAIAHGSITGPPRTFAHNRLVIVVPSDNPAQISQAADLANDELRLVLAQAEVPAGWYARASLCAMGNDAASYGDQFVARISENLVSEEEDVRAVLAKVQLGEADAGIVYLSDLASAGDAVQAIQIPDAVNVRATYQIGVVAGAHEAQAEAFIAAVIGPNGQAILAGFGLEPVT
ncbi:MAG: molybdate ABC transporter substrate-binding protein [Chloroflexota bacterium]|nr:molybdate ABC transporter substrate-binding protein [Chloroflexota bacterium]